MEEDIKKMIHMIYLDHQVDLLDVKQVKRCALDLKMYKLIVFINNKFPEYMNLAKAIMKQ